MIYPVSCLIFFVYRLVESKKKKGGGGACNTNILLSCTSFIYTYKFFTRGIHEIYTPAIKQSDWSECTSHGTTRS